MNAKRYKYSKIFRALYTFLGFVYHEIVDSEDVISIHLRRTRKTATCPRCGRRNELTDDFYPRTIRDLDLSSKRCYISFHENKVDCLCGFRGYEKLDFVRSYSRCTIRFEEYVYVLCQKMSLSDVCDVTKVDWKTAKDIDIHYTKMRIASLKDITPHRIGIDEIAYEKGHNYLTVVRDLDLNKVIWVGLERKMETLNRFFDELGPEKVPQIEVAVVDMWDPYIASLHSRCPGADIVFDKFHVIKTINEALDEVRRKEFAKADEQQRLTMKRKRFLILRRQKNLNDEQRETLMELMEQNDTLYKSYLLKEQLSDILEEKDASSGFDRMKGWLANVTDAKIGPFTRCAETVKRYFYGIANYFRHGVTNAGSEGFNNKINIIKRRAYGYSDLDYFILKIFQACGVMKSSP